MIVVMDRGYASQDGGIPKPNTLQELRTAFSAFEDVYIHELIPTIDSSYRTIPDREHRAMAGLSMGGMQTMFIALHHTEIFSYIATLSGPIVPDMTGDRPYAQSLQRSRRSQNGLRRRVRRPSGFQQENQTAVDGRRHRGAGAIPRHHEGGTRAEGLRCEGRVLRVRGNGA